MPPAHPVYAGGMPGPIYAVAYPPPAATWNGLAIFGFCLSLVGLFIPTGIVSLLGLLISLVALTKPPRGFAIFGVLLGLLGTLFWFAIMITLLVTGMLGAIAFLIAMAVFFVFVQPETLAVTSDMMNILIASAEHEKKHGTLPESVDDLELERMHQIDPWGMPYRLVLTDDPDLPLDIISAGPDSEFDTDDDIRLSRIEEYLRFSFEQFGDRMETFGKRMEVFEESSIFKVKRARVGNAAFCTDAGVAASPDRTTTRDRYERLAEAKGDRDDSREAESDSSPLNTKPAPEPEPEPEPAAEPDEVAPDAAPTGDIVRSQG
ncbi:MAG: hypothetical protein EA377_08960 [Phycisphaerales bacterium]|nr:MAG: hypothetical protein EA377_08960 [Phycisphaerales bacterium]